MAMSGLARWNLSSACVVLGITLLLTINVIQCKRIIPSRGGPIGEAIFDVTKFGAKGDGVEDDTMVRLFSIFE